MALRGKDGSMDEAVEACLITMEPPVSYLAMGIVLFTAWTIYSNSIRIQRKFLLTPLSASWISTWNLSPLTNVNTPLPVIFPLTKSPSKN
eukprot:gene34951-43100_t